MKDKIIIVEDDQDTTFILSRLLSKNNFDVKIATNGEEALNILNEGFFPHVILADWTMPIMDGLELCKAVKGDENLQTIYFIMLTARSSIRDRVKGLEVGADDFLMKPIDNTELMARIRSGVRIFKLQNQLRKVEHSKALVEMACTIGHKFNNPLSSLIVSIDSLKDELPEDFKTKYAEDLSVIKDSIERITSLVKELTKLDDPKIINYLENNKMINLGDD